jgi:hypothetical protein
MFLWVPDRDWEPVPFADADVSARELPRAKELAIKAFSEWGVLVEASRASRIGRDKLHEYMRQDPVFNRRMKVARRNCIERVEREMIRRGMIAKGELAAIFTLKHNKSRYREIQRVELTGRNGAPVAYVDAKAELLKRLEGLAIKSQAVEAQVVGDRRPRLISGGSDAQEASGVQVKKIDSGKAWGAKSRK